ncbi:Os07g0493332 [Oryza sativa Japonica Group]|nr:Os07g0493332 [Oryza sativa Japonica Group]
MTRETQDRAVSVRRRIANALIRDRESRECAMPQLPPLGSSASAPNQLIAIADPPKEAAWLLACLVAGGPWWVRWCLAACRPPDFDSCDRLIVIASPLRRS